MMFLIFEFIMIIINLVVGSITKIYFLTGEFLFLNLRAVIFLIILVEFILCHFYSDASKLYSQQYFSVFLITQKIICVLELWR